MEMKKAYKQQLCVVSSLCIATSIVCLSLIIYNNFLSFLFGIVFFVLYFYLILFVMFQGELSKYFKFKKLISSKERECVFCNGVFRAVDFYMMNIKRTKEEIAKVWNDENNKFYCSDCYLNFEIENNLKTPYNGHYLTDLFLEDHNQI